MSIIKTENLNLYYGSNQALKDVTIELKRNKTTALIGPSGCGKSTFLKTINRMNDIINSVKITGKVTFEDLDIYSPNIDIRQLRKMIGMVFQKPNPFPLSIYENVTYSPRFYKITEKNELDEIVEKCLKRVAMWEEVKDRLKKPALSLSGGQQQRLCIARALAVEPEVLLMDEPTSALDPLSTLKIEDLMNDLARNYTVVIVTHNMQQAARIADDTAFFLNGEIVEFGETKNIFSSPVDNRTNDYITGRFG
jgi:phosphate transport system ATP-binding protein